MTIDDDQSTRPVIEIRPRTKIRRSSADVTSTLENAVPVNFRGRFRPVTRPSLSTSPLERDSQTVDRSPASGKRPTSGNKELQRGKSNLDENGDYIVGKGRPPVSGQIKAGEVRNPRGPKKGEVDFIKAVNHKLAKKFAIKLGGKKVLMSTVDLVAHNMRALVIDKNLGAMKVVADWAMMGEALSGGSDTPSVSASQLNVINQLLADAGYEPNPVVRKKPGELDILVEKT